MRIAFDYFALPCYFFFVLSAFTIFFATENTSLQADILIADFEGETYGNGWIIEGNAFGIGPAKGTLKGQMKVEGFSGNGLVNSFLGGDGSTGKLTSPSFRIERPFISFLIGGGGHEGVGMNLLVDDKPIRTARGPNIVPGGSEKLQWTDWDVSDLHGKEARIEIFDRETGGWGHINVDHIIQTNEKRAPIEKRREILIEKDFVHIPITMNAPTTWIRAEIDGQWQQEFNCPMTVSGKPDFYANLRSDHWKGKKLTLIAEKVPQKSQGLELARQSDLMAQEDSVYTESLRPQFHFTTRTGWINDPNGLVYYKGVWHLFYQHNPFSTNWGNMTWGHATSPDLLHWTEHPVALQPDKLGTIFSGCGLVDWNNTSGFAPADCPEKPLVFLFSYSGGDARFGNPMTQGLAYSLDGGKTLIKYDMNPVIPHIVGGNRDPKVIWYEPTKSWIMALYMDKEDYALFRSKNLKEWEQFCDIKNLGCTECPDFFPIAVDGNENNVKWVFWGGNGKYLIGSFDGQEFKPETKPLNNKYGGNDYAAMTYSDTPDGRRIQLSWMSGGRFPEMPFNHQFTIPRVLTLRMTPSGDVRLYMEPIEELKSLRNDIVFTAQNSPIKEEIISPIKDDLLDAEFLFDLDNAKKLNLSIAGRKIVYDAEKQEISLENINAPLVAKDGKLKLRILVDWTSIEMFAQDGEVQIAQCFLPNKENPEEHGIRIRCENGQAVLKKADVWKMNSIWKKKNRIVTPNLKNVFGIKGERQLFRQFVR